jgi:EAL domain-containing protein (putative c-di-GMP-specific phosphodiesterase class I)
LSRLWLHLAALLGRRGRLRRTEILLHGVVQNSFDAIVTFRGDGTVESLNPSAERLFGRVRNGTERPRMAELLDLGAQIPATTPRLDGDRAGTVVGRHSRGGAFPLRISIASVGEDHHDLYVACMRAFSDVDERRTRDRSGLTERASVLMRDLRRAIEEDELRLYYQPKLDAVTDRVVGVEALVRWHHPVLGTIAPQEFIGLAEQSGLIRPLTRRVLDSALTQAARWSRAGSPIEVAVNISARNLLEEDLPGTVQAILERVRVPAGLLVLEITESVIMSDPERAREMVRELDRRGVSIAIDDFGTGYSSLSYLKRLAARELKIDRSFVKDMDRDRDDATIVRSTIELAHNLGLRVVAEGVERPEIWDALKLLGCDTGQGHLFSRPLPAERLTEWLESYRPGVRQAVG